MADEFGKMGETLQAKTGKGLDEWIATARATGIAGHMALVNHLKSEHGLGHGYANMVVHAANASSSLSQDDDALVAAAFDGARARWRPLYDRLVMLAHGFGDDVELAPKKGYVSLRRKKQFALLQPSTKVASISASRSRGRSRPGNSSWPEAGMQWFPTVSGSRTMRRRATTSRAGSAPPMTAPDKGAVV